MKKLQTVAELPTFTNQAAAIFSAEEKEDVISFLAANPLAGDEFPEQAASARYVCLQRAKASAAARG